MKDSKQILMMSLFLALSLILIMGISATTAANSTQTDFADNITDTTNIASTINNNSVNQEQSTISDNETSDYSYSTDNAVYKLGNNQKNINTETLNNNQKITSTTNKTEINTENNKVSGQSITTNITKNSTQNKISSENTTGYNSNNIEITSHVKNSNNNTITIQNSNNNTLKTNTVTTETTNKDNQDMISTNISTNNFNVIMLSNETSVIIPTTNVKTSVKTTLKTAYINDIIYVSTSGSSTSVGDTESNPTTISNAITIANGNTPTSGTWTIKVADGTYTIDSRFTITKNITINGTTKTVFSGQNKISLFYLNNGAVTLTLNNINFTNCSSSTTVTGGVITAYPGNLIINNCNFTSNKATNNQGGAIVWYIPKGYTGSNYINITNSQFINNSASKYAGALRLYSDVGITNSKVYIANCNFTGNLAGTESKARAGAINLHVVEGNIINCTFTNNTAGDGGGAIRTDYILTINNTVFDGNKLTQTSTENGGTAIYNNNGVPGTTSEVAVLILNNCTFKNHSSNYNGTVYTTGNCNLTVIDCNFTNNTAMNGSAIYNSGGSITINGSSIFKNGQADYGGAIFNTGGDIVINTTTFENNTAKIDGGVIYNTGGSIHINQSSVFKNNSVINATTGISTRGGVLFNTGGSVTIDNSTFESNFAARGGVIYNSNDASNIFEIVGSTFRYNSASARGGVIGSISSSTNEVSVININTSKFEYNNATEGGVVYTKATVDITNSNFTYNNATVSGGVIYNNATATDDTGSLKALNNNLEVVILKSNFTNNKAITGEGGAIYNQGELKVNSSAFENNTAKINGGAVYTQNPTYGQDYINNSYLRNNTAGTNGGAIYNINGAFSIYNSELLKNNATYGGVIYNQGTLTSKNNTYHNNSATEGGVVYNIKVSPLTVYTVTFANDTFMYNNATNHGGAIAIRNMSSVTIDDCNLTENTAKISSAAISIITDNYVSGVSVKINNSNIIKNVVTNRIYLTAGAIGVQGSDLLVENSNFTENVGFFGGALILTTGSLNITNSSFINNTAYIAGAVANVNGVLTINNNTFINNTAKNNTSVHTILDVIMGCGGAIGNNATLISNNNTFDNNSADYLGGALYNNGTIDSIKDKLYNNDATVNGGAIYTNNIENGISYIRNGTLNNNTAGTDGGAIYNIYGTFSISNSKFRDNNATLGGVIYNKGSLYSENNTYEYNKAAIGMVYNIKDNPTDLYVASFYNDTFNYNNASDRGGAISIRNMSSITVNYCNFTGNNATNTSSAISLVDYFEKTGSVKISNSNFTDNNVTAHLPLGAGAIGILGANLVVDNSTFTRNFGVNGGAFTLRDGKLNVTNSNFINNTGYISGAFNNMNSNLKLENDTFDGNIAMNDTTLDTYYSETGFYTGYGGAVINNGTLTSINNTFNNNFANVTGGAIFNNGTINSTSDEFNHNKATNLGGALYTENIDEEYTIITDGKFTYNNATEGGAVYLISAAANITSTIFDHNNATNRASAIAVSNEGYAPWTYTVILENCNITNNKITNITNIDEGLGSVTIKNNNVLINNTLVENNTGVSGAGITTLFSGLTVNNSVFKNNSAVNAGALNIYGDTYPIYIDNSTFIENTATYTDKLNIHGCGGAILTTGYLKITNSNFERNNATNLGGAVYNYGILTIDNNTLKSNIADFGGAVYNNGTLTSNENVLSYNNATKGGALYNNGTLESTLDTFSYNNATHGGAMYVDNDENQYTNLTNDKFLSNNATDVGALYLISNNANITSCVFDNNIGYKSIGAIYIINIGNSTDSVKGLVTINDTNITNNQVLDKTDLVGGSGAIVISHNDVVLNSSRLINNTGVYGGAISTLYAELNVTNSFFKNNTAISAGGINNYLGNLTVKNTTFIDNKAFGNNDEVFNHGIGGAVMNFGDLIAEDNTFEGNNATSNGGALYNNGDLNSTNNLFNINSANKGGALYNNGTLNSTDDSLYNNNATNDGGAIYISNTETQYSTITHGEFINNTAIQGAGLFLNGTTTNITYSVFDNNTAVNRASAILVTGNINHADSSLVTINYCNITNNDVSNKTNLDEGLGAVAIHFNHVLINNTNVINNTGVSGAGITTVGSDLNVTNSYFKNNTAVSAGALNIYLGKTIIKNNTFIDNVASTDGITLDDDTDKYNHGIGGAIRNTGDLIAEDNTFEGNNAASNGGALYNNGNLNSTNNTFKFNNATKAGALYNNGTLNSTLDTFTNNTATHGGAMYVDNDITQYTNLTNDKFIENNATDVGALYLISNNVNITSCLVENNTAKTSIAAIYITNIGNSTETANGIVHIESTNITNNDVLDKTNLETGTGAIVIAYNDVTINNTNVSYNDGVFGGGMSVFFADVNATNSTFRNNTAVSGGALNIYLGNVIINNDSFINNTAFGSTIDLYNHGIGGAISNLGSLTATNNTFDSNNASKNGGAIYNNGTIVENHNNYYNNIAELNGGALYQISSTVTQNCNFENNTATNGGAVYVLANTDITASNLTFLNNSAKTNGGAIYFSAPEGTIGNDGTLTLEKMHFENNTATNGGAIYNVFGSGKINNTVFIGNTATNNGGTLENSYILTVENSTINNSKAANYGGVVYNTVSGTLNMNNVTIENNTADVGGVAYNLNNMNLNNSVILNNTATNGALVYNKNNFNLSSSDVENNLATSSTGFVLYSTEGTTLDAKDNLFVNNTDNVRDMLMYNEADVSSTVSGNVYIDNMLNDTIVPIDDITIGKTFTGNIQINLRNIYNDLVRNGTMTLHIYNSTTHVDKTFTASVKDGVATFSAETLDYGLDTVDVTYTTLSKHYQSAKTSFNLNVSEDVDKQHTNITIDPIADMYVNTTTTITVHVTNTTGAKVNVGQVNITIDGVIHTVDLSNDGSASYKYKATSAGIKSVTAIYLGNTTYYQSLQNSTTFNVNKMATYITIDDIKTIDYGESTVITVKVKVNDANGNPVPSGSVTLKIDGQTYTCTVENGQATLDYTPSRAGTIEVYAQYQNNAAFKDSNEAEKDFTVNKATPIIKGYDVIGIATDDVKIFASVINNEGNPVTDGFVNFYNGTELIGTAYLNENGIATITTQFLEGTYTITLNYTGSTNYNNNTTTSTVTINKVKTNITIDPINDIVINQTTTINATLKDENGVILSNQNVTIIINGNEYVLKTDENGKVSQEFTSPTATDISVLVKYNGTDRYASTTNTTSFVVNKINTIINVGTLNTTYANTTIQVNVTDIDDKKLNEGTINVYDTDGKLVGTATIKDGTVDIKLDITTPGDHTLTINYTGSDNYNYSTVFNYPLTVDKIPTTTLITVPIFAVNQTSTIIVNVIDNIIGTTVTSGTVNITITDSVGNTYNKLYTIAGSTITIQYMPTIKGTLIINASYVGNDKYQASETLKDAVVYDGAKTLTNTTIDLSNITNATIGKQISISINVTDNLGNKVNDGKVNITLSNGESFIVDVKNGQATLNYTPTTAGKLTVNANYTGTDKYYSSEAQPQNITVNKIQTQINATVINSTIGNVTVKVNVTDVNGNPVNNGTIIIYDSNGTVIGTANITNGTVNVPLDINGTIVDNITIVYNGTDKYSNGTEKIPINVSKLNTITVVNPVKGIVFDNTILQANITDIYGNPINGGVVVFKINGETIKDTNGNPIYVSVINGTAKLEYNIPVSWAKDNLTIKAVYGGIDNAYYGSRSLSNTINVSKRNALITVITTKPVTKADNLVQYMAVVRDSNGTILNSGVVVFKFQGHTITDSNGTTIKVNVTNGMAILNYTIPDGISAHNYTITAVYSNKVYNRAENTTTQVIKKMGTVITINPVTTTNKNNITITGTIKDTNGHMVVGTNRIAIKINGKTIVTNVTVTNGKINITIPNSYKQSSYTITAVTGERLGYLSSRSTGTPLTIARSKTAILMSNSMKLQCSTISSVKLNNTVEL